jgi:ATP-dependent DNA helicase RecQ
LEESRAILKQYWGYHEFRPPQEQIIDAVLNKIDTIALLPTGGGKSICFQLPALLMKGKTLVISPLIALMQDQVDTLFVKGILARSLNSNMNYREIDAILDAFVYGDLKILYISPERITSEVFLARIKKTNLSLIAVDEAHCISQWGYDFRPSYFNIPLIRELHPATPIIALTATATTKVISDITEKLLLKNVKVYRKSFSRENLGLTVINTDDKSSELLQILFKVKGCTIIYVRNRRETIEIAHWLTQHGISCASYHGGMDKNVREKNQQSWMSDSVRIMVSTNAFGMGIDKPDVRLVVHLDVAPSIEEYYQEAGRAGRDGKESFAITIINNGDISDAQAHFNDQFPSIEIISSVYDRLCRYHKVAYGSGLMESFDFHILDFADYLSIPVKKVYHILNILDKEGWVAFSEAFKEPSKMMILANLEDFEYFDSTKSLKSKVLTHLLRKYEGLFVDYVKIDESRICKELKMEEPQLIHVLTLLKSEGMIAYIPRASLPQITFTKERPHQDSFTIDKKSYLQRKKMAADRLKAMIQFVQNDHICRQKIIIDYFDENGQKCGKCDICLGSMENTLSSDQIAKVLDHLLKTIAQNPIDIKTYTRIYPFNKRKRIIKAIKDFEAEGFVSIGNAGLITLRNR